MRSNLKITVHLGMIINKGDEIDMVPNVRVNQIKVH